MSRTFMRKENRDEAFFAMPLEQRRRHCRRSQRNALMHPMYIEDYERVTKRRLIQADKGFGNTIYKTHFSVIYTIEKKPTVRH